ncbi:hypothetical protein [Ferruginibacter sp.]
MKPGRIILSIALAVFALARFASTCAKNEEQRIVRQFNNGCTLIENQRAEVLTFSPYDKDSIEWMAVRTRQLNNTVDSCIKYYQDIYKQDEDRYKGYLSILFQYKKMVYLYQGWVKFNRDTDPEEKKKTYSLKLNTFRTEIRNVLFEKDHKAIENMLNR